MGDEVGSKQQVGHESGRYARRPDVLLIMFDDIGFSDLGCYGSEIATPNLDRLAAGGHRYNNFHATTLCSPSRACLLSGRNHHAVGMRMLTGPVTTTPAARSGHQEGCTHLRVLRESGWNTFAAGKWHLLPADSQDRPGPTATGRWPGVSTVSTGFWGARADHYYPELVRDNHHIEPPARPEDGYH